MKVARAAIEQAVLREAQRAAQRLAEAPLDTAKLESYAERQRETYAAGDYLRQTPLVLGAVDREEDPDAFRNAQPGHILPKRPFTAIEGPEPPTDVERPADTLVLEQLHGTYAALAELALAKPVDGEGTEAAAEAVAQLRNAGHNPDVVLVPAHVYVRELLSGHPAWSWDPDPMRQAKHCARLSGVPVYEAGPLEATALVVCELGAAVRRLERLRTGDESPVRVEVKLIDEQRAAELLDAGYRAPGVDPVDLDAQAHHLLSERVEVHVDMDVRWLPPEDTESAALRVELPPAEVRGRGRT